MLSGQLTTLQLLEVQNLSLQMLLSYIDDVNSLATIKKMTHLNRILRNKNQRIRERLKRSKQQGYEYCNFVEYRMREEVERATSSIQAKVYSETPQDKKKDQGLNALDLFQNLDVEKHMRMVGWKEESLGQSVQPESQNQQSMDSLIECFRHILSPSHDIQLCSKPETAAKENVFSSKSINFLHKIIASQSISHQKGDLFSELCWSILPSLNNRYINILINHLQANTHKAQDVSDIWLDQIKSIHRWVQLSISNEDFNGVLREEDFWRKILYLMRKPPNYHNLIEVHLRQHQNYQLARYFIAKVNGQNADFEKDNYLYHNNSHYREFLLIIERKWHRQWDKEYTDSCSCSFVATLLKQVYLCKQSRQNYREQQQCLTNFANSRLLVFKEQVAAPYTAYTIIQDTMKQLLYLGQYIQLLKALYQQQKISSFEMLGCMLALTNINAQKSTILLYNPQLVISEYIKLLKGMIAGSLQGEYQKALLLLKAFLKCIVGVVQQQQQVALDILTANPKLFEYLVKQSMLVSEFAYLELGVSSLPLILSAVVSKHEWFTLGVQIALSSCLSSDSYETIFRQSSSDKSLKQSRIKSSRSTSQQQQEFPYLIVLKLTTQIDRIQVLPKILGIYQEKTIQLITNGQKRNDKVTQLLAANQKLVALKLHSKKQMISIKALERSGLVDQLRVLDLLNSILRLQLAIQVADYPCTLKVMTLFVQDISPAFEGVVNILDRRQGGAVLIRRYLQLIVQSISLLLYAKPRIVKNNRHLLKIICRDLTRLVRQNRRKQEAGSYKLLLLEIERVVGELTVIL